MNRIRSLCPLLLSVSALAACGDDDAADPDPDAGTDAPPPPPIEVCSQAMPPVLPQAEDGVAKIVTAGFGLGRIPDGFGAEIMIEGAMTFRGPLKCPTQVPPGPYTIRFLDEGEEVAAVDIDAASGSVTVVGVLVAPGLEPEVVVVPWDQSLPDDGLWRVQFANFTPRPDVPLEIWTFPPGTPRIPPPDAVATLIGTVPRGGYLTALVPPNTSVVSYLPQGSGGSPHEAATALGSVCVPQPDGLAQVGAVHQIWCDSRFPAPGREAPCEVTIGGELWSMPLDDIRCTGGD